MHIPSISNTDTLSISLAGIWPYSISAVNTDKMSPSLLHNTTSLANWQNKHAHLGTAACASASLIAACISTEDAVFEVGNAQLSHNTVLPLMQAGLAELPCLMPRSCQCLPQAGRGPQEAGFVACWPAGCCKDRAISGSSYMRINCKLLRWHGVAQGAWYEQAHPPVCRHIEEGGDTCQSEATACCAGLVKRQPPQDLCRSWERHNAKQVTEVCAQDGSSLTAQAAHGQGVPQKCFTTPIWMSQRSLLRLPASPPCIPAARPCTPGQRHPAQRRSP
jgi:hypothetical protein